MPRAGRKRAGRLCTDASAGCSGGQACRRNVARTLNVDTDKRARPHVNVTPGELGVIQRCSKVAPNLSQTCRTSPQGPWELLLEPGFGAFWSILADLC